VPTCFGVIALVITMIALAITATPAHGASTRAEYVAQVDPICKSELRTEKAVIRPAKKRYDRLVKRGLDPDKPSKPIGRLVIRVYDHLAQIQREADSQIATVPPAPGDESTVTTWLQDRAAFTRQFKQAGHAFGHQKLRRFYRLILGAYEHDERAEELIQDFGFSSCTDILPGFS
jgi:hypothetical protein